MFPINVVEKETNISKYLLRMWERRYEFPKPQRDPKGERLYSALDVEKLKILKTLMADGYRPSKIINKEMAELKELLKSFDAQKIISPQESVIIVTTPEFHEKVASALKIQDIKKIIFIADREDLQQLDRLN